MSDIVMTQFVIYASPADYPGKWVMRRWFILEDNTTKMDKHALVSENLDALRELPMRQGMVRLERAELDDPAIFEVWI